MAACRPRVVLLALVLCVALCAPAYAAGILCGTVRDAVTSNPIAGAGIFLRQTTGQYTGLNGATDATGHYCINGIPAGTYDLEVRLDDYQVAYRRGVVVNDVPVSVDVDARFMASTLSPAWPNPSRESVRFRMRIRDSGAIDLTILDVNGRLMTGWTGLAGVGEERVVTWDFRDTAGRRVPAGRYFVRLSAGDRSISRAFARIP
ncbi:MAG: T9SS type A sorting domain-containing protein [Candidatus Eisenbacteria bacterium]|uniref:T9SS type A sorting domain-containing protein n=1 Tax=Eiseniibacteriota bacterium TaxID=2212470 RepID=A0A849SF74_UNCEI|nr:T9SS type A sorting domain-containing protein [Candidatus Eisenbacteria bacterium]